MNTLETYEDHLLHMNEIAGQGSQMLFLYFLLGFGFLVIKFVRVATQPGMVLGSLDLFPDRWYFKPIWQCEYCMSSLWGSITFLAGWHFGWVEIDPVLWVFYCVCLCGLIKYFDDKREVLNYNIDEGKSEELERVVLDTSDIPVKGTAGTRPEIPPTELGIYE